MKFTINGTKYEVTFSYGKEEVKVRKGVVTRRVTIASLNALSDEDKSYTTTFQATASCSEKDRFSKNTGRKIALARLLKEFMLNWKSQEYKNISAFIWFCYFTRNRKDVLDYVPSVNYTSYISDGFRSIRNNSTYEEL